MTLRAALALAALLAPAPACAASPCEGVDLGLSTDEAERLMPILGQPVRRSFAYDDWRILDLGGAFLFYRGDPARSRSFARWTVGHDLDEESQIREWAYETAPAFPWHLAKCFAWRVTANGALVSSVR